MDRQDNHSIISLKQGNLARCHFYQLVTQTLWQLFYGFDSTLQCDGQPLGFEPASQFSRILAIAWGGA